MLFPMLRSRQKRDVMVAQLAEVSTDFFHEFEGGEGEDEADGVLCEVDGEGADGFGMLLGLVVAVEGEGCGARAPEAWCVVLAGLLVVAGLSVVFGSCGRVVDLFGLGTDWAVVLIGLLVLLALVVVFGVCSHVVGHCDLVITRPSVQPNAIL